MAGRAVDRRGVATAIAGAAPSVAVHARIEAHVNLEGGARQDVDANLHQERVASRVGEVVGYDAVRAALRGRGDRAFHTTWVYRAHAVRHGTALHIGQRRAVSDDVI